MQLELDTPTGVEQGRNLVRKRILLPGHFSYLHIV